MTAQTQTSKLICFRCLFFDYEHKLDDGLERAVSTCLWHVLTVHAKVNVNKYSREKKLERC